jgi:hypothetical protein
VISRWLLRVLDAVDTETRRLWAVRLLLWSVTLGALNIGFWAAGVVSDRVMLAITLALSWLAITITAADVVVTSDVRASIDEDG